MFAEPNGSGKNTVKACVASVTGDFKQTEVLGYRTYLDYISTDDPSINCSRTMPKAPWKLFGLGLGYRSALGAKRELSLSNSE